MTRQTVPAALLADVKNYLNITWNDEVTDEKIKGLIASAAAYLDGMPRTLLMEYCRYARDSALDVFETNYQSLILSAQQDRMVIPDAVESALQTKE